MIATWPETPRPPARDARGRRVIHLEGLDSYGPLRVSVVDAAHTSTDLGEGSDPRMDGDAIAYLESRSPGGTSFVRVHPDGTVERRAGGTGLMGGLGGPVSSWQSPFTRDGRYMAFARGCEEDIEGCALSVFDHYPVDGDEPVDALALEQRPSEVLLSEDGVVVAACTRASGAGEGTLLIWNRASDAQRRLAITGRCLAMSASGEQLLTANYDAGTLGLIVPATGSSTTLELGLRVSGAAFDACAQSVVVVGAVPGGASQRALRVFFDGRPPALLLETSDAEAELTRVEVDARGWVLVASDEPGVAARAFVVSVGGHGLTEWTLPGRVFGASLGPSQGSE